jgi:hypothetical protein
MSEFKERLKTLDDDALDDAAAAVGREKARRSQRPPSEMSAKEFEQWSADEIRRADAARAKADQEQADG